MTMRYLIEVPTEHATTWGKTLSDSQRRGELKILEKTDPQLVLEAKLADIRDALEMLKKVGYNSDVMRSFIHDKNKRISYEDIDNVLAGQLDFLKQIGALRR